MKQSAINSNHNFFQETGRHLLGCFEAALFMPIARQRFGDTFEQAIKSFLIPMALFPLTLMAVYMYPKAEIADHSAHFIALLYGLRMFAIWGLYFSTVYWIAKEVDRKKHFFQFVVASNWLAIPSTIIFLPVAVALLAGTHSWPELYPFTMCLMMYSYAFTGFMAARVLRIPMELAGFITFMAMAINANTLEIIAWVGETL